MAEFCTCGAELPPEARFCHKCGKPQREEDMPPPPAAVELELPPQPVRILLPEAPSFHNPIAVRIGLLAASAAALLNMLPVLSYGFVIWLVAAGFFSVYLYQRRTRAILSVRQGARMGWITGVISFAISAVFFTLSMISLSGHNGGLATLYRERLQGMAMPEQSVQEALRILESPAGLTITILGSLCFVFVMVTLICTAGGALGAKILDRE